MATKIKPQLFACFQGISPGAFKFPSGYKVKSTSLGDTFPGFGPNVIPLTMQINTSDSGDIKYNNITAATISRSAGQWAGGGHYRVDRTSNYTSGTFRANGVYLPYYFNYNFDMLKSSVITGNPLVWLDKSGGIDINPPKGEGWKFKSVKNEDVFPGFGENVIPVTSSLSVSTSYYGSDRHDGSSHGEVRGSSSNTVNINSKEAVYVYLYTKIEHWCGINDSVVLFGQADSSGSAVNVFLPYFYNFDYSALKAGVQSGTILEWFQKG